MKRTITTLGTALCVLVTLPAYGAKPVDLCRFLWKTDCASALKQFRIDAEKGDVPAMINIAAMYRNGSAVPQDDTASFGWHMRAAQTGNLTAETLVAEDYIKGYGVPVNYVAGASWYRSAAERGNAAGMNGLADLYATGRGVPRSNVEALKWYVRAKAASSPEMLSYRVATAAEATLIKRMTQGEIAFAKSASQRHDH